MNKITSYLAAIVIPCLLMSSCAPLIVSGVVVGGLTIADRREKLVIADDKITEIAIMTKVRRKYPHIVDLNKVNKISFPSVQVTSYNNKVLLVGMVESEAQKQDIIKITQSHKATANIYTFLEVSTQRNIKHVANDVLITAKVRMALINSTGFFPNDVKIVTYSGTTYVFGLLTHEEQQKVSHKISTTPGVQKVITLYENYHLQTKQTQK